jgi:FkbM family methyltransferase
MFKSKFKSVIRSFGWQIQKIDIDIDAKRESASLWLKRLEIKTVLDIGANDGEFARHIRQVLPKARIYSFEPLEECFASLRANFERDSNFSAINLALGDKSETTMIYRSAFSPSSSLLPMAELHKQAFPYTSEHQEELIQVEKLDNIASQLAIDYPLLVKIDVQGFEAQVISGGINTLSKARIIIVEMSIEQLYEGQELFDSIYRRLYDLGFYYSGNYSQMYHPHDGCILQVDAIFMRGLGD